MIEFLLWIAVLYALGGGFSLGFFTQMPWELNRRDLALIFLLWPWVWYEYFR